MMLLGLLACVQALPARVDPVQAAEPSAPSAPTERSYEFDRSCAADTECAVVYAIAGLESPPQDPAGARCGELCSTAIRVADVQRWESLRIELEPLVPCARKQAKCPSLEGLRPACLQGRCVGLAR